MSNLKKERSYRKTFPKSIRLKSVKDIDTLFRHRFFLSSGPFRLFHLNLPVSDTKPIAQYMVSVPKKNFAHAVDRNRIKRLMREALRLEKSVVEEFISLQSSNRYIFALTYTGKKAPEFAQVCKSVQHLLLTWISKHEKDSKNTDLPTSAAD